MKPRFLIIVAAVAQAMASPFIYGQDAIVSTNSPPVAPARVGADWPPTLDTKNTTTQSLDGRTIERYIHGPREEWGYPANTSGEWGYPMAQETGPSQQNHNSFYLVAPKVPQENAPLCVVLHSANMTGYDYLGFECLNRKFQKSDDPAAAITNSPDNFYALYLNSTNAEWWGWSQVARSQNLAKHINVPTAAERRVLDTIEWVVSHHSIDRNRIYLCGVSMGGCGTLGIGLPHGDIFASIRACVPAGTGYAMYRMGRYSPAPAVTATDAERAAWIREVSGIGRPDPPVVTDFSSQVDNWAITQPALVEGAPIGHLPLILSWGVFGHTGFTSLIGKDRPECQVALAYPWLEIRRNEAYPVFARASCDQQSPWSNAPVNFDPTGQTNAYFRWKNEQDTPTGFAMSLWIDHPEVANSPQMPDSATADVTLRRLQQFRIDPLQTYIWQLTRNGQSLASGKITPDEGHFLTIPQVILTTAPVELSLKPDNGN